MKYIQIWANKLLRLLPTLTQIHKQGSYYVNIPTPGGSMIGWCYESVCSPPLTPSTVGTPSPPMTPLSPDAPPGAAKHTCSHLHTIGGMGGHKNICTRCSQKKWPLMRRPSARKAEQRRSQNGEVTVLAVGRCVSALKIINSTLNSELVTWKRHRWALRYEAWESRGPTCLCFIWSSGG